MIIRTFKVLKNNWKKSVFFAGLISYGANYLHTNYKINCLMKEYCENAQRFGEERLSVFSQPKHITVILNPRSKKNKSRQYFNDYVAPILHCAGFKVSVIETESQGQAVKLLEIMSNTDAVLIAGGSGTIQEAITGLLRRDDANQFAQNLPIGFLPLGSSNRTFFKLFDQHSFGPKRLEEVKLLADSTMKVLNDKQINLNVLRIHNLDSLKTVFSLNKFEFGFLSELSRQFPKYWYLGDFLAQYYVYYKSTLFKNLNVFELGPFLNLNYTEKCTGCSKCYNEFRNPKLDQAKQRSGGWFSMFRPVDQKKSDQIQINLENKMRYKINPNCGQWKSIQLDRLMNVQIENCPKSDQAELKLKIFRNSNDLTKTKFFDYMKNYPNQVEDGGQNSLELNVKDLRFDISSFNQNDAKQFTEQIDDKTDGEETDAENKLNYLIDDENYDVKNNLEINSKFRKILTYS